MKHFESGDLPSLTFCKKDHNWRFSEKNRGLEGDLKGSIWYEFNYTDKNEMEKFMIGINLDSKLSKESKFSYTPWINNEYYSLMTDVIITNISTHKCVTLFSKLNLKSKTFINVNVSTPIIFIYISDMRRLSMFFSIHPRILDMSFLLSQRMLTNLAQTAASPAATRTYCGLSQNGPPYEHTCGPNEPIS